MPGELVLQVILSNLCDTPIHGVALTHTATNRHYRADVVVLREADCEPCVVYREVNGSIAWCRPVADFFGTLEDGRPRWTWPENDRRFMEILRGNFAKLERGNE